mgnify:CR=1 FL=1
MHPVKPDLVGKNLIDLKSKLGVYYIKDLIEVAKKGGGIVTFDFEKPNDTKLYEKMTGTAKTEVIDEDEPVDVDVNMDEVSEMEPTQESVLSEILTEWNLQEADLDNPVTLKKLKTELQSRLSSK